MKLISQIITTSTVSILIGHSMVVETQLVSVISVCQIKHIDSNLMVLLDVKVPVWFEFGLKLEKLSGSWPRATEIAKY